MEEIVNRTLTKISKDLLDCAQECLDWIARDLVDPSRLAEMLKGFNLDAFNYNFTGMAQQPGFDAYKVLGLDRTATDAQVKAAYREQMGKLHPDVAGERFSFLSALVNIAYQQIARERGFK